MISCIRPPQRWIGNLIFGLLLGGLASFSVSQDDGTSRGVTVKGQLRQQDDEKFRIELEDLSASFDEQVTLPTPPLPADWAKMPVDQRRKWFKEFESSEAGKQFFEDRKQRMAAAHRFPIALEPHGRFVIYDVPPGRYLLQGRRERETDGKNYLYEVFGVVDVGEEVDEVLLDPIQVSVTRLLRSGDNVPTFEIPGLDAADTITHRQVAGQFAVLHFWSVKSSPSLEFSRTVSQAIEALPRDVQLLSVCVDSDREQAKKQIIQQDMGGLHGFAASWDDATLTAFGVRQLPTIFLLSPDGKIMLSNADVQQRLQSGTTLVDALAEAIQSATDTGPDSRSPSAQPDGQHPLS